MEIQNKKFIEIKASEGKTLKDNDGNFVGDGLCFMILESENEEDYISKYEEVDIAEYEEYLLEQENEEKDNQIIEN